MKGVNILKKNEPLIMPEKKPYLYINSMRNGHFCIGNVTGVVVNFVFNAFLFIVIMVPFCLVAQGWQLCILHSLTLQCSKLTF